MKTYCGCCKHFASGDAWAPFCHAKGERDWYGEPVYEDPKVKNANNDCADFVDGGFWNRITTRYGGLDFSRGFQLKRRE